MEGTEQILAKVGEIAPILARIKHVQRQTRWLRIGFLLLTILIILGWTWSMISHVRRFDMDRFGQEMGKKAEATWPLIADELNQLVNNVLPVAESALSKELEKAAPQLDEKFNSEAKVLENNVKQSIANTMKRFLQPGLREGALKEIQAAYPELGTPEAIDRLVASLQESFLLETQKRLTGMLASYYDVIMKYDGAFKALRQQSAGAAPGARPATLETVLELWIELVYEKMGGDSKLETAPAPAKKTRKG